MTKKEAKEIWETNRPHMEQEIINFYPTGNVFIGMTGDDMEKLDEYFADPYWQKGEPTEPGWYLCDIDYECPTDRKCPYEVRPLEEANTDAFGKVVKWHKIELYEEKA